jgi:nucleotide-binding universal stress UspA family protein
MFDVIAWATDGSEPADKALPMAKSLAKQDGAKLVVIHVDEMMIGRAAGYPVHVDSDELKAKVRACAEELRGEGIDVDLRLARIAAGGAAHVIADVARDTGADLIVTGTRGHGALAGLLAGSVTQRLLHIAPCPVLAVPSRNGHGPEAAS